MIRSQVCTLGAIILVAPHLPVGPAAAIAVAAVALGAWLARRGQ